MGSFFVNLRTVEEREGQEGPVRKQDKGDMRQADGVVYSSFSFSFFFERIFYGFYSKGILNIVLCFIIHFGCSVSENCFI